MAAIENNSTNKRSSKGRMNKKSTRVDFTPMVDLGFLLITFFVFTSTMSKPTVMKVDMPFDKVDPSDPICNSCVLTAVLCKNDRILYYEGDILQSTPAWTDFDNFRQVLLTKKDEVRKVRGSQNQFVLIIKPAEDCIFRNFVDITDEVTINGVKRYYIDDLRADEKKFLKL